MVWRSDNGPRTCWRETGGADRPKPLNRDHSGFTLAGRTSPQETNSTQVLYFVMEEASTLYNSITHQLNPDIPKFSQLRISTQALIKLLS